MCGLNFVTLSLKYLIKPCKAKVFWMSIFLRIESGKHLEIQLFLLFCNGNTSTVLHITTHSSTVLTYTDSVSSLPLKQFAWIIHPFLNTNKFSKAQLLRRHMEARETSPASAARSADIPPIPGSIPLGVSQQPDGRSPSSTAAPW